MNVRIAAVAVLSAAAVATGATAAVAAPAPAPSITLKASKTGVKLGDIVTFTGKTTGVKEGSKVTLQVKDGKKWVALPVTTKVKKSAYKLTDKFEKKGVEVLRVKDGATVSKTVTITVK
ncbi:hypothetical protein [Streptomyces cylindrosporus]|uniref:Bacterial Ig domain-containing protein n=1 Tax=Streptomyces cylindrosporus TaxID=2927583 RepID=A0ABS9YLB5_9ACTN|nr:hypothetical protein [Streptomyces cylindrosporus]MCI3276631.1 hypothetical protein [Streptomyces cylindrosporus]